MGHRKKHAPKRGSLAYLPRKRAKKPVARIRYWPKLEADNPRLLAFIGYKAGMTYVFTIEDRKRSPNFGKEVVRPATVIETPPILIIGIRTYTKTPYGLKHLTEAWMKDPPAELDRKLVLPQNFDTEKMLQNLDEKLIDSYIDYLEEIENYNKKRKVNPLTPRRLKSIDYYFNSLMDFVQDTLKPPFAA